MAALVTYNAQWRTNVDSVPPVNKTYYMIRVTLEDYRGQVRAYWTGSGWTIPKVLVDILKKRGILRVEGYQIAWLDSGIKIDLKQVGAYDDNYE